MLPNKKFEDYNQAFAKMLEQMELWISSKAAKEKANHRFEDDVTAIKIQGVSFKDATIKQDANTHVADKTRIEERSHNQTCQDELGRIAMVEVEQEADKVHVSLDSNLQIGKRENLNSKLWHACTRPHVSLPPVGNC